MIFQVEIEMEEGAEPTEDNLFDWLFLGIRHKGGTAETIIVTQLDPPPAKP